MVSPNPVHGRLVHATQGTFWDWHLQNQELKTVSGKVGKSGRVAIKSYSTTEKAEQDLNDKLYKKLREGFQYLAADNPGPIVLQSYLTNEYTGFLSLAIDSERNLLAAVRHTGQGEKSCEVVIIDAATGVVRQQIGLKEFDVSTLQFFSGDFILQADDRVMRLDLKTGATSLIGQGGVFPHLDFDLHAGRLLYSDGGDSGPLIKVVDLSSGETLLERGAPEQRHVTDHRIRHEGALSPSGKLAAICLRPGEIEIHDVNTGKRSLLRGEFPCAMKMEFHPSEKWLGFSELYGRWRFRLWRIADSAEDPRFQSLRFTNPNGDSLDARECYYFAFSPDGRVLALRDYSWIRAQDFESQAPIASLLQRHVAKTFGTSGFRMLYGSDGRLLTRTDRGIVTVYQSPTPVR